MYNEILNAFSAVRKHAGMDLPTKQNIKDGRTHSRKHRTFRKL